MSTVSGEVRRLRDEMGVARLDREVVMAEGEGIAEYLQGQVSQDIAALRQGQAAWSFALAPQGKVDAWFRITRLADDRFVIDVDSGWAAPLIERLERFRLRTPVTFEIVDWQVVAVRGAGAPPPAPPTDTTRGVVVPVEWPGETGWDLVADASAVAIPPDLPPVSPEAMEVLRIEAGRPKMGAELDGSTIPAEAGVVPQSVSFTKGCFTGQELVARIDSRGSQTPRRLVGLRVQGQGLPHAGDRLLSGADEVGWVTSVAADSSTGEPVALAYLARAVDVPMRLTVGSTAEPVEVLAVALPLVTSGAV
jgi:tRNA-modifying protein YgfZ